MQASTNKSVKRVDTLVILSWKSIVNYRSRTMVRRGRCIFIWMEFRMGREDMVPSLRDRKLFIGTHEHTRTHKQTHTHTYTYTHTPNIRTPYTHHTNVHARAHTHTHTH